MNTLGISYVIEPQDRKASENELEIPGWSSWSHSQAGAWSEWLEAVKSWEQTCIQSVYEGFERAESETGKGY